MTIATTTSRQGGAWNPRRRVSPTPRRSLSGVAGQFPATSKRDPPISSPLLFLSTWASVRSTEGQIGDSTSPPSNCRRHLLGHRGVARALTRLDVQDGYFDRLLLTPVRRLAILLGHMVADVTVACALIVPIIIVGFIVGVRFETGPLGILAFIVLGAMWSLAFSGFGYAIALKTGNPGAVKSSFLLFFPFLFLTTSYVPRDQLSGWLETVAKFNPVTYLLEGMRSLIVDGWEWDELAKAVIAIAAVGAVSMSMCFAALRGRIRRG